MSKGKPLENESPFSLVAGGPLFQFCRRIGLAGPDMEPVPRRIAVLVLLTWVPPLVLSFIDGRAFRGVGVSFLSDWAAQARFLLALPLLVIAERVVHDRIGPMIPQLVDRGIIPEVERPRFQANVRSVLRWRNSIVAELLQLLLTFVVLRFLFTRTTLQTESWLAVLSDSGLSLTKAGSWYTWISMPILEFLLLRWFYRWGLWTVFLWRVSRLPLRLVPTHPDRSGGLAFLSRSAIALGPVVMAISAIVAGVLASKIAYNGAALTSFKFEILTLVILLAAMSLAPLCFFIPSLLQLKLKGELEYGALASAYVGDFDAKWNKPRAPASDDWLGSSDIQSLADIGNSYAVIDRIQIAPFQRDVILLSIAFALIPLLPLVLFVVPLNVLILKLVKIVF